VSSRYSVPTSTDSSVAYGSTNADSPRPAVARPTSTSARSSWCHPHRRAPVTTATSISPPLPPRPASPRWRTATPSISTVPHPGGHRRGRTRSDPLMPTTELACGRAARGAATSRATTSRPKGLDQFKRVLVVCLPDGSDQRLTCGRAGAGYGPRSIGPSRRGAVRSAHLAGTFTPPREWR
jgi:hypothetical protein